MSVRKTGVMNLSSRRLLAMIPFMLLFSGCLLGEEEVLDKVRLEFQTIDRVSLDLNGRSVRLEGTGLSYGSYYQRLAVSFELSDENFRCLLLAESARRDGYPLAIQGLKESSSGYAVPLWADTQRMQPACAPPSPEPSASPPSPEPSASPPSPEPSAPPYAVAGLWVDPCHDTISNWDYPLVQLEGCSLGPKPSN